MGDPWQPWECVCLSFSTSTTTVPRVGPSRAQALFGAVVHHYQLACAILTQEPLAATHTPFGDSFSPHPALQRQAPDKILFYAHYQLQPEKGEEVEQ